MKNNGMKNICVNLMCLGCVMCASFAIIYAVCHLVAWADGGSVTYAQFVAMGLFALFTTWAERLNNRRSS